MFDLVVWAIIFSTLGFWLARWWVSYRAKRATGELRAWEVQWVDRVERVVGPVERLWKQLFTVRTQLTGNSETVASATPVMVADTAHLAGETDPEAITPSATLAGLRAAALKKK